MSTKTKNVVDIILNADGEERSKALDILAGQISTVHGQRKVLINRYFLSSMHHLNKGGHVSTIQKHIDFLLESNYKEYDTFAIALRYLTPVAFSESKRDDKKDKKWITVIHKNNLPQNEISRRLKLIIEGADQASIINGFSGKDTKEYKKMKEASNKKWLSVFEDFIKNGTCRVTNLENKEETIDFEGDIYKLEKYVKKIAKDRTSLDKGEKKEVRASVKVSRLEKSMETQETNINNLMSQIDNLDYLRTIPPGELEKLAESSRKILDKVKNMLTRVDSVVKRIDENYDQLIKDSEESEKKALLREYQEKVAKMEKGDFSDLLKKAS